VGRSRIKEDHTSSSDSRIRKRTDVVQQYAAQIPGPQTHWTKQHGRTSGPPTLIQSRGDRDSESDREPSDSSTDNDAERHPQGHYIPTWQDSSHRDRSEGHTTQSSRSTDINLADQPAIIQPALVLRWLEPYVLRNMR